MLGKTTVPVVSLIPPTIVVVTHDKTPPILPVVVDSTTTSCPQEDREETLDYSVDDVPGPAILCVYLSIYTSESRVLRSCELGKVGYFIMK